MKKILCFVTCVCCCAVLWASCPLIAEAQESTEAVNALRIGTMDLPPYGWENSQGEKLGIIYELNQEIGKRSGMKFTNEIYPFKRMLNLLKNGELDLLSSQAHREALEVGDKLAIQFNINVIAATKKGSKIRTIGDFKGKNMVYHRSASYKQLEGVPREIIEVNGYQQVLSFLYNRPNADGAVFSEPAYYYWMQYLGLTPDDFGNVIMIEPNKEQWIFVRRGLPQKTRDILKQVVEEIYQSSLYEQLLIKYGKKE